MNKLQFYSDINLGVWIERRGDQPPFMTKILPYSPEISRIKYHEISVALRCVSMETLSAQWQGHYS